MKTKVVTFVNQQRFREHAVMYKKHWWSRWQILENSKGFPGLFDRESADKFACWINEGVIEV